MSIRLFNFTPKHWRNGTTFLGKNLCWLLGEENYDSLRVWKRTMYAEWWYVKQQNLYWLYIEKPEWANFLAIPPKTDSSHGFPWKNTPPRYSQFAEDNFNSDGYVGWYTYLAVGMAALWNAYIYFWPRRWANSYDFLLEDNKERLQYIDAFMTSNYDQILTYWWNYWQYILPPHKYHWFREDRSWHFMPDSKIQSLTLTLNKRNTSYDHHWRGVGYEDSML